MEAFEVSGLLTVVCAAVFHGAERVKVFQIARIHGYGALDMLQCCDLIAQTTVCKGAEIVPAGIALRNALQDVQRLLISVEADILPCSLLVTLRIGLIGILPLAAEGIVAAVGRVRLFRVGDLLIGRIDTLHLTGRLRITGVQVRMVFLCQPPVGFFDLLIGGIRADSQNLIGIFMHDRSLFPF